MGHNMPKGQRNKIQKLLEPLILEDKIDEAEYYAMCSALNFLSEEEHNIRFSQLYGHRVVETLLKLVRE